VPRKLRATVARERSAVPATKDHRYGATSNDGVLSGVLLNESRVIRDSMRTFRVDTNANRKHGGPSMYYLNYEGLGQ
jgi:hypothetical protein